MNTTIKQSPTPFLDAAAAKWPRVQAARDFAREAHNSIEQVRKYTGEPYWYHTEEVADTVASVLDDADAIIAALLHDYREDVVTKLLEQGRIEVLDVFEKRYESFGKEVDAMVVDLTDVYVKEAYPDKNRNERKHLERERIGKTSPKSKTIKLADLLSNTKSIVAEDKDFAKVYIREKEELLHYLKEGDTQLLVRAGQSVWDSRGQLGLFRPYIVAPDVSGK